MTGLADLSDGWKSQKRLHRLRAACTALVAFADDYTHAYGTQTDKSIVRECSSVLRSEGLLE